MKRIIVFNIVLTTIASAQIYYWETWPSMPTPRSFLGLIYHDYRVYAIGGENSTGVVDTMEVFNSLNQNWTGNSMPDARSSFGCARIGDKIYVIGGWNGSTVLSSVLEYDITSNIWTTKAPMPTARQGLVAVSGGGKIYAIGGSDGNTALDINEVYDPINNSWESKSPMVTPRFYLSAQELNNKIYVIGGTADGIYGMANNEEYDFLNDQWSTKVSMPTPRFGHSSGGLGEIFAIGGFNGPSSMYNTVEEYVPSSNSWDATLPMPTARWGLGVCSYLVSKGKNIFWEIYAIGGQTAFHSGWTGVNEIGWAGVRVEDSEGSTSSAHITACPNPFRKIISIKSSGLDLKDPRIYDASGRIVKRFSSMENLIWNGTDDQGNRLPSGVYFFVTGRGDRRVAVPIIRMGQ